MINKICPESLHDRFAERSSISKYDKRKKTDLQIPRLNLDFSRKSFNHTGLKTWNSVPTHIRESLTRFKNEEWAKKSFSKLGKKYVFTRIHGRTVLAFICIIKHALFTMFFYYTYTYTYLFYYTEWIS